MKIISAKELEEKFDNNEDVSEYMDFSKASNLGSFLKNKSNNSEIINIEFPKNVINLIDKKVNEIGVNRESFIKMIVAERLNLISDSNIQ